MKWQTPDGRPHRQVERVQPGQTLKRSATGQAAPPIWDLSDLLRQRTRLSS